MALPQSAGIRVFDNRDLEASDRIARHIQRGGLAVLEGRWDRILRLRQTLQAKGTDRFALRLLALRSDGSQLVGIEPTLAVPGLWALTHDGTVALEDVLFATNAPLQQVDALGAAITTIHPDVLVPRSQPLIHLMRRALEAVQPDLPTAPAVLDMGCGSGVCALLAAKVLPSARVTATDHLPEAVASTQVNAERLGLTIETAQPGDLYETLNGQRFDLIIFNAPWVAAPARNRMETALNDGGQQTIRRFLMGAAAHLNPGGRVIVGYADHSGPKAIANLERFIAESGLQVADRLADRIKTHRSKQAWESIFAYLLRR